MACDHVRSFAGGTPPVDPLPVVLRVASFPAELLAKTSVVIKMVSHPVPTPTCRFNVADHQVVPAERRREHRPRSASEVRVGRVPTKPAIETEPCFDRRATVSAKWGSPGSTTRNGVESHRMLASTSSLSLDFT